MLEEWPDGRIKLFVTALGMRLRRALPALFIEGEYEPLSAEGPGAANVVAFARQLGTHTLVVLVPRLTTQLQWDEQQVPRGSSAWGSATLELPALASPQTFRDLITGASFPPVPATAGRSSLPLERVLESCPVTLLWAESS
jgi:(1->4)-alpha-D-glucan 1-alpha-D-glucosylmutase